MSYKIQKINKVDIAKKLLERAVNLYYMEKDYFSTLHLAGAAEEVLGQLLKTKNIPTAFESEKADFILIRNRLFKRDTSDKDAADFLNKAKNAVKHLSGSEDVYIMMDPMEDAEAMLERAINNLWRLEEKISPEMAKFLNRNL